MSQFNVTIDDQGLPTRESCMAMPFFLFYNTPEVVSGFEQLYHNIDGFQDKFISFWE